MVEILPAAVGVMTAPGRVADVAGVAMTGDSYT